VIVSRPNLDAPSIRALCSQTLKRDLTIHGRTDLSLLSKLIAQDEYSNSIKAQKMLFYTLAIVADGWVLLYLQNLFDKIVFYNEETVLKNHLCFMTGSLFDFMIGLRENCTRYQNVMLLKILNTIAEDFEREGYGLLISKEHVKTKSPDGLFFLEKK
jgi:hypothetical protein